MSSSGLVVLTSAQEDDSTVVLSLNSPPHNPSGKEAFLHVALEVHFLFLCLQNKFENSWLPSFSPVLSRRYFKNVISLFSLFCQA